MSAATTLPAPAASILDLPDGLHAGISEHLYHQRIAGVASKSALDLVAKTPATYAAWLTGVEREQTPALALGKALHCGALEPDVFAKTYTVEPDFGDCRFKEAKAARDKWRKDHEGFTLLDAKDADAINGMIASLRRHPIASGMLGEGGRPELTLKWTDIDTGIICKGRADLYIPDLRTCFDLKTTDDAGPTAFAKSCASYGYHRQQAHYEDGFAALGAPLDAFVFVAVEKVPPYLVGAYALDAEAVGLGREWVRRTLGTLAACIDRGEYPGYSNEIEILSLPRWAT